MSYPRIRRCLKRFGLGNLQVTSRAKTRRQYDREVEAIDHLIETADRNGLQLVLDRQLTPAGIVQIRRGRYVPLAPKYEPLKGFVYIVSRPSSAELKVGFARDVDKRFRQLQSANGETLILVRAIPGTRQLEDHAHGQFEHYRKRGEWYEDVPEIRDWEGEKLSVPLRKRSPSFRNASHNPDGAGL